MPPGPLTQELNVQSPVSSGTGIRALLLDVEYAVPEPEEQPGVVLPPLFQEVQDGSVSSSLWGQYPDITHTTEALRIY